VDVDVAVPVLLAVLAVSAALIRRWWALVVPLAAVPFLYAGLRNGWWGDGVGEGWQYAAVMVTAVGLLASALGVVVGRALARNVRH
jgi:hypothetical protein